MSNFSHWQIFIETKEEWKRQLSGLQICKEGTGRMKRGVKGRKAKEKSREQNSELRPHLEQSKDKEDFFKTRQCEKFDMSYIHQEDDKSENSWSRINEDRDRTCNIFSDFELIIDECDFQGEGQATLRDMLALINMKEDVNYGAAKGQFSFWKQEDESKQQVDLETWNRGRRVGIALNQIIAEEEEDFWKCGSIVHRHILLLIQRRLKCREFILRMQLENWVSSSTKVDKKMEKIEQSSIINIFSARGQYIVERLYVLVLNNAQSSFEIGRTLLKLFDRWMMTTTKIMSIRNFQSQRIKGRWKDIQNNIKKLVYRQKEMLRIESEVKRNNQVQDKRKYMKMEINSICIMTGQQWIEKQRFMLFEEVFIQGINTKTLCKGDPYECRTKRHPQQKDWQPRETKEAEHTLTAEKDQVTSWVMDFDEVYNRGSRKTHEQESMETFNFGSLMQEHSGLVNNVIA